jgi:multiple sugar transport system permease protein
MGPSDWSNLMAASVLAAIPVLILFAALQRFLVEGLSAGAVKS